MLWAFLDGRDQPEEFGAAVSIRDDSTLALLPSAIRTGLALYASEFDA